MKTHINILRVIAAVLFLLCAAMAGANFRQNATFSLLCVIAIIALLGALLYSASRIKRLYNGQEYGKGANKPLSEYSLQHLNVPVAILEGKNLVWYNSSFKNELMNEKDATMQSISKIAPGLELKASSTPEGQNMEISGEKFTVYSTDTPESINLHVVYFVKNTMLKNKAEEYEQSRPCVMYIVMDTYDELKKELKESERAKIVGSIDYILENFIAKSQGFLQRTGSGQYTAVIEERYISLIIENRFAVLDKVREIGGEAMPTTLSIGVGRGGESFDKCEKMASSALDMALGRGGDQAAIKTDDGFEFYGGVSRSVEKRNKVKSRIIAAALTDLIAVSDSVIVMGHKLSDLDCVGAAIGVMRLCKACNKPCVIAIDEKNSLATNMIHQFKQAGLEDDFMHPEVVKSSITQDTLLIVVDTHVPAMLESEDIYRSVSHVVVIDHHRKMVGHIDNAVISYHEPYASSASELVAELLQYIGEKDDKPTPLEAQSLLAGIMLDTRNFAIHTGVRTFEAAAFLRRMGAQTGEAKKLFAQSFESYGYKARLVTNAEIYKGCAVVISDDLPEDMRVVIPQAANDLLTIQGVDASFVAVKIGDTVAISARSMGEVNVQVIMEQLGGGGHHTMAGAQIKESSEKAKELILNAIDGYRKAK